MSRYARLLSLPLVAGILAGCAALQGTPERDPETQVAYGLAALERDDYRAAFDHLTWVYTNHWDEPIGQQALLALAAAELDPRNPSRRIDVGARLAADYLRLPGPSAWTEPVVETLYLLGLELGGLEREVAQAEAEAEQARAQAERAEERAQQAQAQAQQAQAQARRARAQAAPRPLPRLPGPPVTARIRELERERNRLAARVNQLENRLAARERELERIRKTLRP